MKSFLKKLVCSKLITVLSGIFSVTFGAVFLFEVFRVPVVSIGSLVTQSKVVKTCIWMLVLTAVTLLLALVKKTTARYIILGFAAAAFVCTLVINIANFSTASRLGVKASFSAALAGEKTTSPADVEIDSYTVFDGRDIGLSLWLPAGDVQDAPVVIWLHSGGWVNGDRFQATDMNHCRFFADNGYLAVNIDYPLSREGSPLYDQQEEVLAEAILWLKNNASQYGGSMDNFYITGASAGGNLGINLAERLNSGEFDTLFGETMPRVKAVSVCYPATDTVSIYDELGAPLSFLVKKMCQTHWGGTLEEYPERYAHNNSIALVDENMAPTLAMYGKLDHMVPCSSTEAFMARLTELGVDNEALVFPFSDHNCDANNSVECQTWRTKTLEWFEKY